ncbi:MAG: ribonuclease P protein component [Hylemonella sp.]|nr:ribonuclease P protein component [Hylemonella sp.]MDP1937703.1 ribonuclease P protein component [Hylemonella sp.]
MQRLKTRAQFQAVLAGRTVARTTHFAMHSSAPLVATDSQPLLPLQSKSELFSADPTWIGAMVPKRWARRAVTRNLIKRQIYSIADHFESSLPHGAHVVRLRSAFDRAHFKSASSDELKKAVRKEIEQLFARATASQVQAEA